MYSIKINFSYWWLERQFYRFVGKNAILIENISYFQEEKEVIFPSGT